MNRRQFHGLLGLSALGLGLPGWAWARTAAYPSRPITLIAPYPPGGAADTSSRRLSPELSRHLGVTVVVENVPGAAGAMGSQRVARSDPDGYTLLYGSPNEMILGPLINEHVRYRSADFTLVAPASLSALVLVGRPDLPAQNIDELVELGRSRAEPLSYASVGVGSMQHIAGELLRLRAGMNVLHVPYKGAAPALTDVMGGRVDLSIMSLSGGTLEFIRTGRLRAYGVYTEAREPVAPDLPTINEGRYLKDVTLVAWGGVFAATGTDAAVLDKLNAAVIHACQQPVVRDALIAGGSQVPPPMTLAQTAAFFERETRTLTDIARQIDFSQG